MGGSGGHVLVAWLVSTARGGPGMRERGARKKGGGRELKDRPILQGLRCISLFRYVLKAQGNRPILQGLMCIFLFRYVLKA